VSLLLLALACAGPARAETAIDPRLAPLLDAASDQTLRRGFVPSEEQKVGEVRLVRRGDAEVVETLLYSKVLGRVVAEIRKKELANWPPGQPGHDDAQRYVEALETVQKQIWDRMPRTEAVRDRRQKLFVDFVLTADRAVVAIGAFEMSESNGEIRVLRREPLVVFEPSRHYAVRNMRLIAADSFHVPDPELGTVLDGMPLLHDATPP
jgi:hypothetical protein